MVRPPCVAGRQVSSQARLRQFDGEDAVAAVERRLEVRPVPFVEVAVARQIEVGQEIAHQALRRLVLRDLPVTVAVVLGDDFAEGVEPDVAPFLVQRHRVAVDEEEIVLDRRGGLHLEREAAQPPEALARFGRVAGEEERARHDDLEFAAVGMVEGGRRVAASRGRPFGAPDRLAGPGVHGQDVGVPLLVDREHHLAGGEDRRGAHAVDVVEGTEGMPPEFFAVDGVAEKPEIAEEDPDALAVGDRRRRRWPVAVVERLGPWPRGLAPPELRPGLAIEGDRVERFAFRGRQEDPLGAQDRG